MMEAESPRGQIHLSAGADPGLSLGREEQAQGCPLRG